MDSWYFSLVLCFERFFWKNQQIFPLLLVKYLSFREGCDGKRNSKALCAAPPGRSSSLILERGTAILAPHTNHRNMLPTDNFLRSLLFSPYWEQLKCRKISKTLLNHKTKLKKIEIGRITILNGSTSIQYGQESITSHNLSTTFNTGVKLITWHRHYCSQPKTTLS